VRKQLGPVFYACLTVSALVPALAQAQMMPARQLGSPPFVRFNPFPGMMPSIINPYRNGFGFINPYSTALLGANPYMSANSGYGLVGAANPYGSYGANSYGANPYGAYGQSPMGAYMQSAPDSGNSEGRLPISIQQANLLKEQAGKEKIENRKKAFDDWLWYRDHLPTPEDDRQRAQRDLLRRSLNEPSPADILSAQALNILLADLGSKLGKNQGPSISQTLLDPEIVPHLNITGVQGEGNPGLFKNEGRLNWPRAFSGDRFKTERELLSELVSAIYDQVMAGRVETGTFQQMQKTVEKFHYQLSAQIKDLTPSQYGEAKHFLRHLDDSLKLLRRPDAETFFAPLAVDGKTIEELVNHVLRKGWRFAPAVPGDESAYLALYRTMAAYDLALGNAQASSAPKK
jgi:hypothetical protein